MVEKKTLLNCFKKKKMLYEKKLIFFKFGGKLKLGDQTNIFKFSKSNQRH